MFEKKFRRLRTFNLVMAGLHFAQGLAMLFLSSDFALPITSSFVQFNPAAGKLLPVLQTEFTLKIGPLIAAFLFISAFAHLMISLPGINDWYNNNLKKGANFARWMEYSISSSLMIVIISMLVGVYDGMTLLCIFFLNAAMILFGWMMELHNQTTLKTDWTSYWFGTLMGAIPWVVVAVNLFMAGGDTGKPPTFVYWIFFSIFLFFDCFAINMALQYKRVWKWRHYIYGETIYIVLSLVAKSLLAWQVWAGTLRPV